MGLKLRFLSWWTPEWFLKRGLNELAFSTVKGLERVLIKEDPKFNNTKLHNTSLKGNLNENRKIMAINHNEIVEIMINSVGREKALNLGREAMFNEGLSLGRKFREMLGVGDSTEDLILAAKILYKILGIEFTVKDINNHQNDVKMIMVVNRCSLSEYYNGDTCRILSAADEGVVQGLNPQIKMNFTERITEGAPCCLATLRPEDENK